VPDPVAWKVIEQGWRVLDAQGNEVGKVDRITGDIAADIFDGITFGDGGTVLTRAKYVPAEHIKGIYVGEVALDLSPEQVLQLGAYTETVSKPLADLAPEPDPQQGRRRRGGMFSQLFRRGL
jgi:hypothetical protein